MDIVKATIQEWRDLGFHYDRDDYAKRWLIQGSREGMNRFAALLAAFAANPRNDVAFEHDHYGPYGYLKVMNTPGERGFTEKAINAPRRDFDALAALIRVRVSTAVPGMTFSVKESFAPHSVYDLVLDVREDGFDPSSEDEWLKKKISEQCNRP